MEGTRLLILAGSVFVRLNDRSQILLKKVSMVVGRRINGFRKKFRGFITQGGHERNGSYRRRTSVAWSFFRSPLLFQSEQWR